MRQSAGKSMSMPNGATPSAAEARETMKEKVQDCDMLVHWHAHGDHVCTMLDRTLEGRPVWRGSCTDIWPW